MTGVQNKELSFVVIERQLIGWNSMRSLDVLGSPAAPGLKDK